MTFYRVELLNKRIEPIKDQDQDSSLVKRRNDNHSPVPGIRELQACHNVSVKKPEIFPKMSKVSARRPHSKMPVSVRDIHFLF